MERYSIYDNRNSVGQGNKAESLFEQAAITRNWRISKSSKLTDMRFHIDYTISKDNTCYTVDVKSIKRVNGDFNPDYIWLEMRGAKGDGWLYSGKSELLAFQLKNRFMFIKRTDLIQWANENIDLNKTITSRRCTDHLNVLQIGYYRRWDKSDILTLVYAEKLKTIAFGYWQY